MQRPTWQLHAPAIELRSDPSVLLHSLCMALVQGLSIPCCWVSRGVDRHPERLAATCMAGLRQQLDVIEREITPLARPHSLGYTLLYRSDLLVPPGIRTLLCVPFSVQGERHLLTVVSGLQNDFGRDERRAIEALARTTGYALSRRAHTG